MRVVGSVHSWNTYALKTSGKFLASHCLLHQAGDLVEMLCGWEVSSQLLDGCGLPLTTYQLQLTAGLRCCRQRQALPCRPCERLGGRGLFTVNHTVMTAMKS